MSAPLTGGFDPGGQRFAVDGDFSVVTAVSAPRITFPFDGDSVFSDRNIVYLDSGSYQQFALGVYPNLQPWSANQTAMILEQDFVVAEQYFLASHLNSLYNPIFAIGWTGEFDDGLAMAGLGGLILVKEGNPEPIGAGLVAFTARWASIPQTRNRLEQFAYNFIGFANRARFSKCVNSRLQFDYFVFDDYNVLGTPLFTPGGGGVRLNASTGLYPDGLILNEQRYFLLTDNYADQDELFDFDGTDGTVPSESEYKVFIGSGAEIVVESSTLSQWMGNIYERRTRFVLAQ